MKCIVFLRKKIPGENSIEELTNILFENNKEVEVKCFPEYNSSIWGIIKNIIFAIKNQGNINHFFSPAEVYCAPFLRGAKIVTWHDLGTDFQTRNPLYRIVKKYFLRYFPMFFCRKITCISENTRNELLKYYPLLKNKVVKIYNPYNPKIVYSPPKVGNKEKIILHIGTGPRKNLERVIEALSGLKCKLHIVGKLSDEQRKLLSDNDIDFKNDSNVTFDRIISFYKNCDIISFPSLYEGFGMPIIEGQATGRPIVTSKSGAIPEIAGDSVMYVDPVDINSIREGFILLFNDDKVYNDLVNLGLNNIKRYTINIIQGKYKLLYNNLK